LRLDLEEVFAELPLSLFTHESTERIFMNHVRKRYVGLDVHKDVIEYCILDAAGKNDGDALSASSQFSNDLHRRPFHQRIMLPWKQRQILGVSSIFSNHTLPRSESERFDRTVEVGEPIPFEESMGEANRRNIGSLSQRRR
jgi:hypothetical protein